MNVKYTKGAFERAESDLRERRERAQTERSEHLEEVARNAPEIYRMYNDSVALNFELMECIGLQAGKEDARQRIKEIRQKSKMLRDAMHVMLDSCGYPTDYLQYHYQCEKCSDTGYHDGIRCECMKNLLEKYITEDINRSCSIELHDFSEFVPEVYSEELMNGISPRKRMTGIFNDCKSYAENFSVNSPSLFFFGKTGLGKTFLSSCIAKKLIEDGHNVVYSSLVRLLPQIEDERFHRSDGDTMSILRDAELVILDDLGSEFQKQFTDSVIYEILNERINTGRPTIISTNLTTKELDKKYNDRIVSRLTGCFMPVMFIGNDVRQEKRRLGLL